MNEMERARALISCVNKSRAEPLALTQTIQELVNGTSIAEAKKWGSRAWDVIDKTSLKAGYYDANGDLKDYNDLNNNQQGAVVIEGNRFMQANINRSSQVPSQVEATRTAAKDTADTETETDWGKTEVIERQGGGSQSQGGRP